MSGESTLRSIVYNGRVYTDAADLQAWLRKDASKPRDPIARELLVEVASKIEEHAAETLAQAV